MSFSEVVKWSFHRLSSKKRKKASMKAKEISSPKKLEVYIAVSDYKKQEKGEVSLMVGMQVEVVEKTETGWWFVHAEEEQGWVPSTCLEREDGTAEDSTVRFNPGEEEQYLCTDEFQGEGEDELTLEKGAVVDVMEKNLEGWWFVRYNGQEGYVPATYLIKSEAFTIRRDKVQRPSQGPEIVKSLHEVSDLLQDKENNESPAAPVPLFNKIRIINNNNNNTTADTTNDGEDDYDEFDDDFQEEATEEKNYSIHDLSRILKANQRGEPETEKVYETIENLKSRSLKRGGSVRPPPRAFAKPKFGVGGLFGKKEKPKIVRNESVCKEYVTVADFSDAVGDGISFETGQHVKVLEKNESGWWYIEIDGKEGWAPATYIEETTPIPVDRELPPVPTSNVKKPKSQSNSKEDLTEENKRSSSALRGSALETIGGLASALKSKFQPKGDKPPPTPPKKDFLDDTAAGVRRSSNSGLMVPSGMSKAKSENDLLSIDEGRPLSGVQSKAGGTRPSVPPPAPPLKTPASSDKQELSTKPTPPPPPVKVKQDPPQAPAFKLPTPAKPTPPAPPAKITPVGSKPGVPGKPTPPAPPPKVLSGDDKAEVSKKPKPPPTPFKATSGPRSTSPTTAEASHPTSPGKINTEKPAPPFKPPNTTPKPKPPDKILQSETACSSTGGNVSDLASALKARLEKQEKDTSYDTKSPPTSPSPATKPVPKVPGKVSGISNELFAKFEAKDNEKPKPSLVQKPKLDEVRKPFNKPAVNTKPEPPSITNKPRVPNVANKPVIANKANPPPPNKPVWAQKQTPAASNNNYSSNEEGPSKSVNELANVLKSKFENRNRSSDPENVNTDNRDSKPVVPKSALKPAVGNKPQRPVSPPNRKQNSPRQLPDIPITNRASAPSSSEGLDPKKYLSRPLPPKPNGNSESNAPPPPSKGTKPALPAVSGKPKLLPKHGAGTADIRNKPQTENIPKSGNVSGLANALKSKLGNFGGMISEQSSDVNSKCEIKPKSDIDSYTDISTGDDDGDDVITTGKTYCAIENFDGGNEGEMKLVIGQQVELLDTAEGWWFVSSNSNEGWVPADFLEKVKHGSQNINTSSKSGQSGGKRSVFRTCSDFKGEEEGEISLPAGAEVKVVDKPDEGWWYVESEGKEGWIPSAYLTEVSG